MVDFDTFLCPICGTMAEKSELPLTHKETIRRSKKPQSKKINNKKLLDFIEDESDFPETFRVRKQKPKNLEPDKGSNKELF